MGAETYRDGRIGFWAEVEEVDSVRGWVSIATDSGLHYNAVPVYSREWVVEKDNYVPSARNLPPVGARVFVLTPTHSIDGAFILCSGFTPGEKSVQTLFAQSDDEKETKNNRYERITQGGWNITENYDDGNITLTSADGKVVISVHPAKNDNLSEEQEVRITAWENGISLTSDGMSFSDKNGNSVSATSDGISFEDKSKNKITTASSGITIEDKNGNKIETGTASVKINGNLEVLK